MSAKSERESTHDRKSAKHHTANDHDKRIDAGLGDEGMSEQHAKGGEQNAKRPKRERAEEFHAF